MAEVIEQVESARQQALDELTRIQNSSDLETWRIKYLGTKGVIKNLMTLLGQVPKDQKPLVGQRVNALKDEITAAFEDRKSQLASSMPGAVCEDITEPGKHPQIGRKHILIQVVDELVELFGRMGFSVATGP